jgi:hypothetical protein
MNIIHNEFTTALPEGWEDRTMITLVAPIIPNQFATNIVITKHFVESNQSLEDFVGEQTKMLMEALPTFEVLDYRINTIKGYPGCQQLHRFQTENGALQQVQTFILANKTVYVITGTAGIEKFNSKLDAFREVVENFEVSALD